MGETRSERAERLKAALRENLRRRKAQARGRAGAERATDQETRPDPDRPDPVSSDKGGEPPQG
jgi:hypothetical protein